MISAKKLKLIIFEGWDIDEHFCDICDKETEHKCKYTGHERDMSGDVLICLECGSRYDGVTGKYIRSDLA